MKDIKDLEEAMNAQERYLYGINYRLNILIEQVSSIVEVLAVAKGVAVESTEAVVNVESEEVPVKKTRKAK
jgi:hypothetical protein